MILSSSFPDKTSEFQMEQKINDQCNFKSAKRLEQPIRPLTHKKGALSSLIERVEIDFIQDMVNSPQKRKHQRMMKKVGKLSESKNHKKNEIAPDSHRIGSDILRQGRCLSEQNSNKKSISSTNQTQLFQNFSIEQQSTIIQKLNSEKIQELRKTSKFCQEKDLQSQLSHDSENKSHLVNEQTSCVDQQIEQIKLQDLDFISESTVTPEGSQDEKPDSKSQQKPFLHIDDFQQISILGQGVYGKVSLARQFFIHVLRHKKTNLVVALKKIDKNNLNKEDSTYLSREIKIQSYADHPNIVQLYSFFHDESNIYLVLEVCNQGNLFSILQKLGGSIQEDKVKKYIRQICKAVQFLHYNEIIHRDLKPQNILVHNGVAKICDFGWAVHAPELRSTLCGTPLYSCPQIVKNQKYDQKIDIWSIGVMTYELIFGTTPFDIKYQEDLSKVIDNTVQYPPNCMISEECKNFINGCLEKHPKDRFQIWELLRHPFICEEEKIRDSLRVCF